MKILITGSNGQLGRALATNYPEATALSRQSFDITDIEQLKGYDWSAYDVIINAAAYVNADQSETDEGRKRAWQINALGTRNLAKVAIDNNLRLIHFSSEYVFDGSSQQHNEDEPYSPLSVYGQTKVVGDLAVSLVPQHHILRTTWVVGDGHNFVRTMKNLADLRIDPKVVDDQFGRLTFVSELVRAVDYVLTSDVPVGTYNVSNSGQVVSWAEIAAKVFELSGHDKNRVKFISTDEYRADKEHFAPRPKYSDLDLSKLQSYGFSNQDYEPYLKEYVTQLRISE